jgi:hypothetical protein
MILLNNKLNLLNRKSIWCNDPNPTLADAMILLNTNLNLLNRKIIWCNNLANPKVLQQDVEYNLASAA